MKFSTAVIGALAPVALASSGCLNDNFERDPLNFTAAAIDTAGRVGIQSQETAQIELYVHVLVAADPQEDLGPKIGEQLARVNSNFAPWGYQFNLKLTTYVIDPEWAEDIDVDKENKMRQLHRGDYQTLNVYMVEGAGGGVCSFPQGDDQPVGQDKLDFDGCFVSLAMGTSPTLATLTHEIGHWLGLMHTFQGGCEGDGDACDDTAPQNGPSEASLATPGDLNSCPAEETCGAGNGFQNVKNFMDYSDCAHEFTSCQGQRMEHSWYNLRKDRALAEGVQVKW